MNGQPQFRVIKPLNSLQAKISTTGGPSEQESIAAAEQALEDIKEQFEVALRDNLVDISDAISRAEDTPHAIAAALKEVYGISHDIKGMAATFDYLLLTNIAESLCLYISSCEPATPSSLTVIKAHAKAMETVIGHSLQGAGGEVGRKLLDILDDAVEKAQVRI